MAMAIQLLLLVSLLLLRLYFSITEGRKQTQLPRCTGQRRSLGQVLKMIPRWMGRKKPQTIQTPHQDCCRSNFKTNNAVRLKYLNERWRNRQILRKKNWYENTALRWNNSKWKKKCKRSSVHHKQHLIYKANLDGTITHVDMYSWAEAVMYLFQKLREQVVNKQKNKT